MVEMLKNIDRKCIWNNKKLEEDILDRQKYLFNMTLKYLQKQGFKEFIELDILEYPMDIFHCLYPNIDFGNDIDVKHSIKDLINIGKCSSCTSLIKKKEFLTNLDGRKIEYIKCDGIIKVNIFFRGSVESKVWVHIPNTPITIENFIEDLGNTNITINYK